MTKYHISPKIQEPRECRAGLDGDGECPYKDDPHFTDRNEAWREIEIRNNIVPPFAKFKNLKDEDLDRIHKYFEGKEKYMSTEEIESRKQLMAASFNAGRAYAEKYNATFKVINGGASIRVTEPGGKPNRWTLGLEHDAEETYIRIFDASVPVYGDHSRNKSWSLKWTSPKTTEKTVERLYNDFLADPENQKPAPMWG